MRSVPCRGIRQGHEARRGPVETRCTKRCSRLGPSHVAPGSLLRGCLGVVGPGRGVGNERSQLKSPAGLLLTRFHAVGHSSNDGRSFQNHMISKRRNTSPRCRTSVRGEGVLLAPFATPTAAWLGLVFCPRGNLGEVASEPVATLLAGD